MKYLVVEPDDALDPGLRADLLDTWIAATDAGGAVGFTPPAPVELVAETLDEALGRVAAGLDLLGVLHNGERYVGMGLLVESRQRAAGALAHGAAGDGPSAAPGQRRRPHADGRPARLGRGPRPGAAPADHPRRPRPGEVLRAARLPRSSAATPARSASPRTTTATRSCWCMDLLTGSCGRGASGRGWRPRAVSRAPRVSRIGRRAAGRRDWARLTDRRSAAGWAPIVNFTGAATVAAGGVGLLVGRLGVPGEPGGRRQADGPVTDATDQVPDASVTRFAQVPGPVRRQTVPGRMRRCR